MDGQMDRQMYVSTDSPCVLQGYVPLWGRSPKSVCLRIECVDFIQFKPLVHRFHALRSHWPLTGARVGSQLAPETRGSTNKILLHFRKTFFQKLKIGNREGKMDSRLRQDMSCTPDDDDAWHFYGFSRICGDEIRKDFFWEWMKEMTVFEGMTQLR